MAKKKETSKNGKKAPAMAIIVAQPMMKMPKPKKKK